MTDQLKDALIQVTTELYFAVELVEIARDCLEQCATQGKSMPGEYDHFLEKLMALNQRLESL